MSMVHASYRESHIPRPIWVWEVKLSDLTGLKSKIRGDRGCCVQRMSLGVAWGSPERVGGNGKWW
jgi:hypothetical protein